MATGRGAGGTNEPGTRSGDAAAHERDRNRPATINDVAAAAGVSRQTVTRAMNDLPDVSAATKQRVQHAASALHYRPNRAAQRLVRGGDVTIGFVVNDLRNPYYPELASELTRLAAEHDWAVMMTDLGGPHGDDRLDALLRRVDAVIGHLARQAHEGLTSRVPTVLLDDIPAGGATVELDFAGGMRDAVAHLAATGRRRIAMIDPMQKPSTRFRMLGAALSGVGLAPARRVTAEATHEGGFAAAGSLARERATSPSPIDAVVCFNDLLAVGALGGFAHAGIRVPQDVAVIGIDGLDIGELVTPRLTTLAVDRRALARHAVDLVAALLRGESGEHLSRRVEHSLVLRDSA
ncbi:LacI family DNA-binding transcriptional regulator [Humibacter albus]|uniref:LacI family DNA-binding transcriptional regulator n=1 Tax=Humibacter albus TaxID=427754 RepID=UPI0003B475E1|nr:LacI family DNA-binding transcriptional regulator [Humibacter albus]